MAAPSNPSSLSVSRPLDAPPAKRLRACETVNAGLLMTFSLPVLEDLHQQLACPQAALLLADASGLILKIVGEDADLAAAGMVGELARHDDKLSFSCLKTPVLSPGGEVAGVIVFLTVAEGDLAHAGALLRSTAALIEHQLIEHQLSGKLPDALLALYFHRRAELLGSPLEGVLVFDVDGWVCAANRIALDLLDERFEQLLMQLQRGALRPEHCFALSWPALRELAQPGGLFALPGEQHDWMARARLLGQDGR